MTTKYRDDSPSGTVAASGTYASPAFNVESRPLENSGGRSLFEWTEYNTFNVFANATQASTANGFLIQYSNDGVTWVTQSQNTLAVNTPTTYTASIMGNFYRISYTNSNAGAVATLTVKTSISQR